MLKETIQQAIQKGLVKSGTIIVDATHVECAVRAKSVPQVLRELTKSLRKEIYKHAYDLSEKFPDKPFLEADISEEIAYTNELLANIKDDVEQINHKEIKKLYRHIEELLETDQISKIRSKDDEDARFGHKTPAKKFFGYKTHLAMRVEHGKASNGNTCVNYCFSVKNCRRCPLREQCKVGKTKTHTYNITQPNEFHKTRLEFESSEHFKEKLEIRHRIEEKNGEMKMAHWFQRADSVGLVAMRLQAYFTAIVVNMKRMATVITG